MKYIPRSLIELRYKVQSYFWTPVEYFCDPVVLFTIWKGISLYSKRLLPLPSPFLFLFGLYCVSTTKTTSSFNLINNTSPSIPLFEPASENLKEFESSYDSSSNQQSKEFLPLKPQWEERQNSPNRSIFLPNSPLQQHALRSKVTDEQSSSDSLIFRSLNVHENQLLVQGENTGPKKIKADNRAKVSAEIDNLKWFENSIVWKSKAGVPLTNETQEVLIGQRGYLTPTFQNLVIQINENKLLPVIQHKKVKKNISDILEEEEILENPTNTKQKHIRNKTNQQENPWLKLSLPSKELGELFSPPTNDLSQFLKSQNPQNIFGLPYPDSYDFIHESIGGGGASAAAIPRNNLSCGFYPIQIPKKVTQIQLEHGNKKQTTQVESGLLKEFTTKVTKPFYSKKELEIIEQIQKDFFKTDTEKRKGIAEQANGSERKTPLSKRGKQKESNTVNLPLKKKFFFLRAKGSHLGETAIHEEFSKATGDSLREHSLTFLQPNSKALLSKAELKGSGTGLAAKVKMTSAGPAELGPLSQNKEFPNKICWVKNFYLSQVFQKRVNFFAPQNNFTNPLDNQNEDYPTCLQHYKNPLKDGTQSLETQDKGILSVQNSWTILGNEQRECEPLRAPFSLLGGFFLFSFYVSFFRIRRFFDSLVQSVKQEQDPLTQNQNSSQFQIVFPMSLFPSIHDFSCSGLNQTFLQKNLRSFKQVRFNRFFFRVCAFGLFQVYAWNQGSLFLFSSLATLFWSYKDEKAAKNAIHIPKAYILTGLPGSGKSVFFQALIRETGVLGIRAQLTSAKTVREVLSESRFFKPCIIFLDHLDTIAAGREKKGVTQPFGNIQENQSTSSLISQYSPNELPNYFEHTGLQSAQNGLLKTKPQTKQFFQTFKYPLKVRNYSKITPLFSSLSARAMKSGGNSLSSKKNIIFPHTGISKQTKKLETYRSMYKPTFNNFFIEWEKLHITPKNNSVSNPYSQTSMSKLSLCGSESLNIGAYNFSNSDKSNKQQNSGENESCTIFETADFPQKYIFPENLSLHVNGESSVQSSCKLIFSSIFEAVSDHQFLNPFEPNLDETNSAKPALPESQQSVPQMKSSGTLLSLLVYLDGSTDSNILLGSTWSTEKLDKALLRPGRFDTILHFSFPEKADRNHILTLHASKHPFPELSPEISWTFFSGLTKSFLPADLVLLVETSYLETCSNYLKKRDNSATGETAQLVENTNQPVIEQANQTSKMPQHTMDSLMNALYSYKKQLKQSQLYF